MDSKEKKIIEVVESLSDEMIDFTRRLVAEASTLENEFSALENLQRKNMHELGEFKLNDGLKNETKPGRHLFAV